MFNVSSQSIKSCNKVMRISEHFHLEVFHYQIFLFVLFQSSIRGLKAFFWAYNFVTKRMTRSENIVRNENTNRCKNW